MSLSYVFWFTFSSPASKTFTLPFAKTCSEVFTKCTALFTQTSPARGFPAAWRASERDFLKNELLVECHPVCFYSTKGEGKTKNNSKHLKNRPKQIQEASDSLGSYTKTRSPLIACCKIGTIAVSFERIDTLVFNAHIFF